MKSIDENTSAEMSTIKMHDIDIQMIDNMKEIPKSQAKNLSFIFKY